MRLYLLSTGVRDRAVANSRFSFLNATARGYLHLADSHTVRAQLVEFEGGPRAGRSAKNGVTGSGRELVFL